MTRPRSAGLAALLLAFVMACSSDEPEPLPTGPTTAAEIEEKCRVWAEVGCRKNDECAGISTSVDEGTATETQSCVDETHAEGERCRRARVNAIDRCSDGLEGETCDEYCGDSGFCFYYCPYFC